MQYNIKITVNECDICKRREPAEKKIFFNIMSDVCNECFFANGASIVHFEIIGERWCVKKTKKTGEINGKINL